MAIAQLAASNADEKVAVKMPFSLLTSYPSCLSNNPLNSFYPKKRRSALVKSGVECGQDLPEQTVVDPRCFGHGYGIYLP